MVEYIKDNDEILAIIIRASYRKNGLSFLTPDAFPMQLGYMNHPENHVVKAHIHNRIPRTVDQTMEVMFVKSGKVLVDIYDSSRKHLEQRELNSGDIILFANGGHGMTMLEQSEIVEVKQGPYLGESDKVHI